MKQRITYTTGRTYDCPQVLEIEILQSQTDDFGFTDGKALFVDRSRHIAGTVDFFAPSNTAAAIGAGVLRAYDSGEYGTLIFSHHA